MAIQIVNNMFTNSYIGNSKLSRSVKPITGYKKTRLAINSDNKISLQSIQGPDGLRDGVPLNSKSRCPNHPRFHAGKPSRMCTCGFYCYLDINDALDHFLSSDGYFTMRTVASGKIIMYEKGVRSGAQRVEEIIIDECRNAMCINPADRLAITQDRINGKSYIAPYCADHSRYFDAKTFDWLAETMTASFENGEPPITVRHLDSKVKPWDGTIESTMGDPDSHSHIDANCCKNRLGNLLYAAALTLTGGASIVLIASSFSWPF